MALEGKHTPAPSGLAYLGGWVFGLRVKVRGGGRTVFGGSVSSREARDEGVCW